MTLRTTHEVVTFSNPSDVAGMGAERFLSCNVGTVDDELTPGG